MIFLSDDRHFGFRVTPAGMPQFYLFQLIFDEQLVGDEEPCIASSSFGPLASISNLEDSRLSDSQLSGTEVDSIINSDDELFDASLRHLAESLDAWLTRLYAIGDRVHILVKSDETGAILRASLSSDEFTALVAVMRFYIETHDAST